MKQQGRLTPLYDFDKALVDPILHSTPVGKSSEGIEGFAIQLEIGEPLGSRRLGCAQGLSHFQM